eukprot:2623905-Amphidinium_carterae.1
MHPRRAGTTCLSWMTGTGTAKCGDLPSASLLGAPRVSKPFWPSASYSAVLGDMFAVWMRLGQGMFAQPSSESVAMWMTPLLPLLGLRRKQALALA